MQDRPDTSELLQAVRAFLEEQVVPALDGTRQFHARVAANVLAIVARELVEGEAQLRAEWERLTALLDVPPRAPAATSAALKGTVHALNEDLAVRIRGGEADREPWRGRVVTHLRVTADERLGIANPRYRLPRREG